ncbi:lipase A [Acaromyces ingoldii]|uniref:triacylglycerol lipase n=1 Tax=Acaromyces ingoldii TaxID=215250 RepID=A0A316YP38_9BASI|nr:lipase A [Acaromyces ingoldii]PWN91147.1 lipase A [Acaromyces ingoldii]
MRFLVQLLAVPFVVQAAVAASTNGMARKRLLGPPPNPNYPDPNKDAFYRIPADVAAHPAGSVLSSREVPVSLNSKNLDKAYQVLYRSNTNKDQADATVATIFTPKVPAAKPGLLSYQVFEDSATLDCAPSWAFINNTGSANTVPVAFDTPFYLDWALGAGLYVVAPDHEGSQAAFIVGKQEGQAVLDGIRAARTFIKLSNDVPVALSGYSGGAHATAWAQNLRDSYAPDVNIIGAVHGGTPVDLRNTFNYLNGGLFSGFAADGLVGASNAYPEINDYLQKIATDKGKSDLAMLHKDNTCLIQIVTALPFVDFYKEVTIQNPLDQSPAKEVLAAESLLSNVSTKAIAVPTYPQMQFHGSGDEIIPPSDHQVFVDQQCAKGANIQYNVLPIAEHISAEAAAIPGTIQFLGQIFNGTTPQVKCGQPGSTASMPSPHSVEAEQIMGTAQANKLRSLNGKKSPFGPRIISF